VFVSRRGWCYNLPLHGGTGATTKKHQRILIGNAKNTINLREIEREFKGEGVSLKPETLNPF